MRIRSLLAVLPLVVSACAAEPPGGVQDGGGGGSGGAGSGGTGGAAGEGGGGGAAGAGGTVAEGCTTDADCDTTPATPLCDLDTGACEPLPPAHELGIGDGSPGSVTFTVVHDAERTRQPIDLEF